MDFPTYQDFIADFDFSQSVLLGGGSFGKVYKAKTIRKINNKPLKDYAVKFVETLSEETFQLALKELQFNSLINIHPNVIYVEKVYAWTEIMPVKKFTLILVMELAMGNLRSELMKRKDARGKFTDSEIQSIMEQCLTTFDFLAREKNLYHRDIKPDNLLISSLNPINVKIADFGASKAFQKEKQQAKMTLQNTLVGTPIFLSPLLWIAYTNGESHNVKHNLEKSDVFSMGLTFLQIILLLSDQELVQCNDSKVINPDGSVFDAAQDEQKLLTCPGYNKINQLLLRVTQQNFKRCLQVMLLFNEKQRSTWQQAIQSLNNQNPQQPLVNQNPVVQKQNRQNLYEIKDKNTKIYQCAQFPMQLMYLDSFASAKGVTQIIQAQQSIIALSPQGVTVYGQKGEAKNIYSKNAKFILYFSFTNELIGIDGGSNIFKIKLTDNECIEAAPIPFVDVQKLTAFKLMRRQMVLASLVDGQMLILDFTQYPPSVIKNFKDHKYQIVDFAYEDSQKVVVSCDKSKQLCGRLLAQENSFSMQTDYELGNLLFINDKTIAAASTTTTEILIFTIRYYDYSLKIELTKLLSQPNHIPLSLNLNKESLVYVTQDELMLFDASSLEQNLMLKGLPYNFQKVAWIDDLLVIYDGQNFLRFAIFNKNQSTKKKGQSCKCCQIF